MLTKHTCCNSTPNAQTADGTRKGFKFHPVGPHSCIYLDTDRLSLLPRTKTAVRRHLRHKGWFAFGCGTPAVMCRNGEVRLSLNAMQKARGGTRMLSEILIDPNARKSSAVRCTKVRRHRPVLDEETTETLRGPQHPFRFALPQEAGRHVRAHFFSHDDEY